ncbi:hypothetical protein M3152_11135 [Sporosarcina luteola]|uniref:hypothetical protein n=1 Tax=Sporosarcina luteola TaxID=582850 RepID=UPI0020403677|nr:hypothetical protein [Sporosarcina luteola]MCM3638280.1 hypothetical protein [Sporosarcina luteola]
MFTNKKFLFGFLAFTILVIWYFFFFLSSNSEKNQGITMALFKVETKQDYTKPGEYTEMWIIGYNAAEDEGNRERYKIFIEEAMVYNLIKEGKEYMISARSFRKDKDYGYAYELNQISNQVEYQIRGKGRIK